MTSPVTTAPSPATRPAARVDAGGAGSAEPFASALDDAVTAGRGGADGTGVDGEQQGSDESADGAEDGAAAAPPPELAAAPAGGLVAALWARLTGTAAGAEPAPGAEVPTAPGVPAATGRVRALDVAAGLAHGLRALPTGQAPAGAPATGAAAGGPAASVPTAALPAVPVPSGTATAPVLPSAAAADAAAALTAAGVQVVVAPAGGTAEPATAVPAPAPASAPQSATGDAPVPAGSPGGTGAAAVAVPPAAGAPLGSGADGRPDDGAEHGPADAPAEEAPAVTTTTAPSAPSATGPVARAEAATGPAAAQPVAGQLARPVAVLRGGPDGTHTMTVVLTPEALGPVEVSVTLSQGTVELTLRGAHDHGRAALIDALPELRRDLEAAGLTCSRVDVDRGNRDGAFSSAQQQAAGRDAGGGRGQHQPRGDGAPPWHRPADNGEGHPARTRNASGLDVRV